MNAAIVDTVDLPLSVGYLERQYDHWIRDDVVRILTFLTSQPVRFWVYKLG